MHLEDACRNPAHPEPAMVTPPQVHCWSWLSPQQVTLPSILTPQVWL
jgi:hypothetical protein